MTRRFSAPFVLLGTIYMTCGVDVTEIKNYQKCNSVGGRSIDIRLGEIVITYGIRFDRAKLMFNLDWEETFCKPKTVIWPATTEPCMLITNTSVKFQS